MRPRWPAPRRQVRGPTRSAEEAEEERGPRGTRAQDAGARRPRVSTQAGAVRLAPCKCPLALRSWEKGRGEEAWARVVRFPRVLRVTWDSPTGGGAEAGVGLVASRAPGCPPAPVGFQIKPQSGRNCLELCPGTLLPWRHLRACRKHLLCVPLCFLLCFKPHSLLDQSSWRVCLRQTDSSLETRIFISRFNQLPLQHK